MSEEVREGKRRVVEEIVSRIEKELGEQIETKWKPTQDPDGSYTLLVLHDGEKKEASFTKEVLDDVGYQMVPEAAEEIENKLRELVGLKKNTRVPATFDDAS